MSQETVSSEFGLRCPECGRDDQLDVQARVWVRLLPDGTDADEAERHDTEWTDDDSVICQACNHGGLIRDFTVKQPEESP